MSADAGTAGDKVLAQLAIAAKDAAALVGVGVTAEDLQACLPSAPALTDREIARLAAAGLDVAIVAAWLLGVPLRDVVALLHAHWSAADAGLARRRIEALRKVDTRPAAEARRRLASKTQPNAVRQAVDALIASGEAKSRAQAREQLAKRLGKTAEYLRKREAGGDTSSIEPGASSIHP
jgi:hypothetical protein